MYKYYFILFFFLTNVSFGQDITASQKIPTNALPGTDFIVETIINKGKNRDFMKFFQEISEGLTATEIESQNGTFTFADGGAKIIWIAPPMDETFTISYKVTVNSGVYGTKTLPAKISYITNNERKTFDFPATSIIIGTATPPVQKVIPSTNPTTSNQPVKTALVTTTPVTTTNPVKTNPPAEQKKAPTTNAASPTQSAIFSKIPTSALPSSTGKMYRVQIGAFSAKPKIDGVPELTTLVMDNGMTKYFSGNYSTYEEALKRKKEMIEKGFQGAFIVSFENGKIVK